MEGNFKENLQNTSNRFVFQDLLSKYIPNDVYVRVRPRWVENVGKFVKQKKNDV